jgi:hypothetical protein
MPARRVASTVCVTGQPPKLAQTPNVRGQPAKMTPKSRFVLLSFRIRTKSPAHNNLHEFNAARINFCVKAVRRGRNSSEAEFAPGAKPVEDERRAAVGDGVGVGDGRFVVVQGLLKHGPRRRVAHRGGAPKTIKDPILRWIVGLNFCQPRHNIGVLHGRVP